MKHTVIQSDLHGAHIRPEDLLSTFQTLSVQEARTFFSGPQRLTKVACPACGCAERTHAFEKNGFAYVQCNACASLYVSLRPTGEALEDYRRGSQAVAFRAEQLTRLTSAARRHYVLRSNALWMGRLVDEAGTATSKAMADLGTNYPLLLEEAAGLGLFDKFYSIDPLPGLETACEQHGASLTSPAAGSLAALTAFEQLEHQFSPQAMLRRAWDLLAPGGMLFLTTRTISGFDLTVLWDKTPYIYVPEHLNLLSIDGLTQLIQSCGFKLIELSTPGQLDVELVLKAMDQDPGINPSPFIKYLLRQRGSETHEDFQAFLQKNRLSSHVRIAAVKA